MLEETLEQIEALWETEQERRKSGNWPNHFPAMPEIPAGRYTSPAFAALEHDHIWRNTWIFAGHESELGAPGDYLTRQLDGVPLLLVRGKDGTIRGFYNVCQHRGAQLLRAERGHADTINCPYHCWSYGTDGKLTFVPEAQDFPDLDPLAKGLRTIHCAQHRGMLFFSLAASPPPLDAFLGGMRMALADVPLENVTLFRREVLAARCNWKCVHDAFSETYHVRYVHAQSVNRAIDPGYTARYMLRGGHNAMLVRARLEQGSGMVNVFDREDSSIPNDAPSTLRPVTRVSQRSYNIFPNLTVPIAENLFPVLAAWPDGPDRCLIEIRFFKLPDGPGSEENDNSVVDAFMAIAGEDLAALEGMQQALSSGGITSLPLGYGEQFIANHHQQLDLAIGRANIPDALRVLPADLPYAG